jgi:uncharacterized MAPEG superfamily protein
MRATTVFAVAWGALILGHWASDKPTINTKQVIEMAFALLVIALLDQGETADIAKGFAWLFLAAVLLRKDSILTALAKRTGTGTGSPR